jgi:hypothetical protein
MKIKITPLNFATAFFLFLSIYVWIEGADITGSNFSNWAAAIGWIFLLFAFAVSFLDLIFRNLFPDIKKVWVIELSFITLATVLFLLLK